MAFANLNEDFGLEELVDQPWYCRCELAIDSIPQRKSRLTTIELSIREKLDEVTAIPWLYEISWSA